MSGIFYCGDNREILVDLQRVPPVDLIYLDPPFNSQRAFNVVYKDSRAQEHAFKDYWGWDEAAPTFASFVDSSEVPPRLRTLLRGLRDLLIEDDSDLLAYLTMMTPRLVALHGVLKPTGSLYLHCDPTASHYLKLILDSIFGTANFRNEIIWKRTNSHNSAKKFGPIHDTILYYARSEAARCNAQVRPYSEEYLKKFRKVDEATGESFQDVSLTGPGVRQGDSGRSWRGHDPTDIGRHWQPASYLYTKYTELTGVQLSDYPLMKRLDMLDAAGLIYWPSKKGSFPRYKFFLSGATGVPLADVWTDIDAVNSQAIERVGYPTQKPLALLERILASSSAPGDLVLDPFCGCGTTIEACERMGRRWIGIDIAKTAVEVTEARFQKLGLAPPTVEWFPHDLDAALALAARSGIKFEEWIRHKLRAVRKRKHDRGIDGEAIFVDHDGRKTHVILSVKGGKLQPSFGRDLGGTMTREKADIGVLVTAHEPKKELRREATEAGFFLGPGGVQFPRMQILTMEQLFSGGGIRAPGTNKTEVPPPAVPGIPNRNEQLGLGFDRPKSDRPKAKPPVKVRKSAAAENENGAHGKRTQRRSGRPGG